jgi:hypothetical protein
MGAGSPSQSPGRTAGVMQGAGIRALTVANIALTLPPGLCGYVKPFGVFGVELCPDMVQQGIASVHCQIFVEIAGQRIEWHGFNPVTPGFGIKRSKGHRASCIPVARDIEAFKARRWNVSGKMVGRGARGQALQPLRTIARPTSPRQHAHLA